MLTQLGHQTRDLALTGYVYALAAQARMKRAVAQLLDGDIDLRSPRGIEGAVWNVLALFVIAAIFIAIVVALGPTIMARAATVTTRLRTNPGW
jgi:ABC-type polysaccharide/polyol phosphate export permease